MQLDLNRMSPEKKAGLVLCADGQVFFAVMSSRRKDASCVDAIICKETAQREARKIGGCVRAAYLRKSPVLALYTI